MKNLTQAFTKSDYFLWSHIQQETCVRHFCALGESFRVWALRLMSAYSETLITFKIPILSWQCCRWLHRWRRYARCISFSLFSHCFCLGTWAVNHRWKKKEKVNYMMILNLVLLQISNKNTELVDNSFKILKCQWWVLFPSFNSGAKLWCWLNGIFIIQI